MWNPDGTEHRQDPSRDAAHHFHAPIQAITARLHRDAHEAFLGFKVFGFSALRF